MLWNDDGQIAVATVEKWRAAQGDAARIEVAVWTIESRNGELVAEVGE